MARSSISATLFEHPLTRCELEPLNIVDLGTPVLNLGVQAGVQDYVQHGQMLYFESGSGCNGGWSGTLYSMDLSSMISIPTIHVESDQFIDKGACFTSMTLEHDYLFLIGGYPRTHGRSYKTMSIYNITNQTWMSVNSGPNMIKTRQWFPCNSLDQKIYAIAGRSDWSNTIGDIEVLDLSQGISDVYSYSWYQFENSIPGGLFAHHSITYGSSIIVFAGVNSANENNRDVFVIDTLTRNIYTAGSLNYDSREASVIMVWPGIYIFGGIDANYGIRTHQYHHMKFSIHQYTLP